MSKNSDSSLSHLTEPSRRWRFQFHLSTTIVMNVVAGLLLWSNMGVWFEETVPTYFSNSNATTEVTYAYYGWPLPTIWDDVAFRMTYK